MNTETLSHFLALLSQRQHTSLARRNALFDPNSESFTPAAVLLPVVKHQEEWQILMTKRADTLRHHTGQIAFPGGRKDAEDASLTDTALREAYEEIGTPPHIWQTFETMPPCYTPSGYAVYTVPALCPQTPVLTLNESEVAEAFYIPLAIVLNTSSYTQRTFRHRNHTAQSPALPYLHYDIWGLTASILYSLAQIFAQHQLELSDQDTHPQSHS
ncbi:MAG: CoA pyrophosphatase [Neisseria sp.]|uniref:CoA pyrophosphatase n=1 Tax=Neisseria sp. TaxID=192066 RepID=UPI0026DC2AE1|nr:CoA pyrophosphatase [Neisseria sp.]MDO4640578.1 CoA pyrophosphatase [Neisseria sp.]